MIKISSPLKRKEIIDLLDKKIIEGVEFSLNKENGMELYFETTDDAAASIAKKVIKSAPFGKSIMFKIEKV